MPSMNALVSTAATLLCVLGANAADAASPKFTDNNALKAAVANCISREASGSDCCLPDDSTNSGSSSNLFVGLDENDACPSGSTHLSDWDVSEITSMSELFIFKEHFNQPLNNWDVSKVTNMNEMFYYSKAFNQPLNSWDVSQVTQMRKMFSAANSFNQDLNDWDVSEVKNMYRMFHLAHAYDQESFCGSWVSLDPDQINMNEMFGTSAEPANGGIGTQESCVCDVGKGTFVMVRKLGECVACPWGTYSDDMTLACKLCEVGKTTSADGATTEADCKSSVEFLSVSELVSAIAQRQGSCN